MKIVENNKENRAACHRVFFVSHFDITKAYVIDLTENGTEKQNDYVNMLVIKKLSEWSQQAANMIPEKLTKDQAIEKIEQVIKMLESYSDAGKLIETLTVGVRK